MGKGHFLLTGNKFPPLDRVARAGFVLAVITIAGCATYPGLNGLTAQGNTHAVAVQPAAAPAEPARASAVADIHARAEAAAAENDGAFPNVFNSYGPSGATAMSRAERLAIEAELDAILAAQAKVTDPAEAERLKARVAYLKRLGEQHGAKAEADIQAASQAAE